MNKNNKTNQVNVRFSDQELQDLRKVADALGKKVSDLIRMTVTLASGELGD